MVDPKLATKYFQEHGLHVAMTFGLLMVAFGQNFYINCTGIIKCYSPVWCGLGWIYLALGVVLLAVARHYRKMAAHPKRVRSTYHGLFGDVGDTVSPGHHLPVPVGRSLLLYGTCIVLVGNRCKKTSHGA